MLHMQIKIKYFSHANFIGFFFENLVYELKKDGDFQNLWDTSGWCR